jgi:carboxypeptidase C (cathepsin A)
MYIFGEGYAGKYASALGVKIIQEKANGGIMTGLRGIGIGNGLNAPLKILE